jgi:DNA mismatch repair protein MutS
MKKIFLSNFILIFFYKITLSSIDSQKFSEKIADEYLRSFPSEKIIEEDSKKKKSINIKEQKVPKISNRTIVSLIFNNFFKKTDSFEDFCQDYANINNTYLWRDLKLVYGSVSAPDHSLLKSIDRTQTRIGNSLLALYLVFPLKDLNLILERQNVVKIFFENEKYLTDLRSIISSFAKSENAIYSLYTESDPLYSKEYRTYMEDYFYSKNNTLNKNVFNLEIKKRFFRDFYSIVFRFTYPFILVGIEEIISAVLNGYMNIITKNGVSMREYQWKGSIPIYGLFYRLNKEDDTFLKVLFIVSELGYLHSCYTGVSNYLEYSNVLKNLALRMSDIQNFIKTIEKISKYIEENPQLEKIYGKKLVAIRELLKKSEEQNEFGNLIKYLKELPYQTWSYFFNNSGKLLVSHTLFVEYKDLFLNALFELGQLDTFISVGYFVKESQKNENSFSFTNFIDKKDRNAPYIKIEKMWNPFIDPKIAVPNDVEMGNEIRHIILTGPNAGGKSTFLTGVTVSIWLSQVFGISNSKESTITPFSKINTYIEISDDIIAGDSLFMAEVKRAQEHVGIIKSLKQNEFSFSITDEQFSGTNPTEGCAAEYSIINYLASYKNNLSIIATHYPMIMVLEDKEKNKGFANFKVFISEDSEKLNYSYKVIRGKSTQTIAIRILEEQGFDTELLKEAKNIIKHPENYR